MTSGTPFPHNLTVIDPLTRPDHSYLDQSDECYFLGEYTARQGYAYSDTNNLIINLKKDMSRRGRPEWQYKVRAIQTAARALHTAIPDDWLASATFVPIPPSKARGDPLHDDRMMRVLLSINPGSPVDCRDLIIQNQSTAAVHQSDDRLGPQKIRDLYTIDHDLINPPPGRIVICDDVLTTGAHFKAVKSVLSETFPDVPVVGCFIARRVPEAIDVEAFFNNLSE